MTATEALAHTLEEAAEAGSGSPERRPLEAGPGVRIVDGRPLYSAAWLDLGQAQAR